LQIFDHVVGDISPIGAAVEGRDGLLEAIDDVSDWTVRDSGQTYRLKASLLTEEIERLFLDLDGPRPRPFDSETCSAHRSGDEALATARPRRILASRLMDYLRP